MPLTLEKREKRKAYRRRKAERKASSGRFGTVGFADGRRKDGLLKRLAGAVSRFLLGRWL